MKEEIIGGLKNALERGSSLDSAAQSFINAGYNPSDVNEAARALSQGASSIITTPQSLPNSVFPVAQDKKNQLPPLPQLRKPQTTNKKMIWLAIILFLVVFIGALTLLLLFSDKLSLLE